MAPDEKMAKLLQKLMVSFWLDLWLLKIATHARLIINPGGQYVGETEGHVRQYLQSKWN